MEGGAKLGVGPSRTIEGSECGVSTTSVLPIHPRAHHIELVDEGEDGGDEDVKNQDFLLSTHVFDDERELSNSINRLFERDEVDFVRGNPASENYSQVLIEGTILTRGQLEWSSWVWIDSGRGRGG